MTRSSLSLMFASAVAMSAAAQDVPTAPPADASKPALSVGAPQAWGNGVELACKDARESMYDFQRRLNNHLRDRGKQRWQLVSASPGPIAGKDCVVLAFRQPIIP